MNDSDPPKPERRWYQFRVRTLPVFGPTQMPFVRGGLP
jgi:hypothetical protein